jgi:hypothetical protein
MQRDSPMPDFDLDSPEEGQLVIRPDGKRAWIVSESQFWRNLFRCLHKNREKIAKQLAEREAESKRQDREFLRRIGISDESLES